jgi:hypothetical protein
VCLNKQKGDNLNWFSIDREKNSSPVALGSLWCGIVYFPACLSCAGSSCGSTQIGLWFVNTNTLSTSGRKKDVWLFSFCYTTEKSYHIFLQDAFLHSRFAEACQIWASEVQLHFDCPRAVAEGCQKENRSTKSAGSTLVWLLYATPVRSCCVVIRS